MNRLNIGQAAAAAGVTPKMIRHYESLGLVPEAERTDAGYRLYGEREIAMLRFIRQCRAVGFSMERIAQLLQLWSDEGRHSREVKQLALQHRGEIEARLRELEQMRATLDDLVASCAGDESAHCPILAGLATRTLHGPAIGAAPEGARATLKTVTPGTRRPRRAGPQPQPAPQHPAFALAAWSHAAVRGRA